MDNLVYTKKLSFQYRKQKQTLFCDLDISINEGEFVALLGSNGSGKSTLLKHFNALMRPQSGNVIISNKWDTKEQENVLNIRQTIGLVFQNPENQIVSTIVEEDIAFALENLGLPREEIRKRVDESLERVDMQDYKKVPPYQLSGGQKQRIGIASILAMKPKCIMFDESTSMLDPKGREAVLEIIQTLNKEFGVTVIMTTHLLEEVIDADRVIVLDRGEVRFDDQPKVVFQEVEALEQMNLNVPLVTQMAHELQQQGFIEKSSEAVLTEEEFVERILRQVEALK